MTFLMNWSRLQVLRAYLQAQDGFGRAAVRNLRGALFFADITAQTQLTYGVMIGSSISKAALARSAFILDSVDPHLLEREFLPSLKPKAMIENYKTALQFESFGSKKENEAEDFGFFYKPFLAFDLGQYYRAQLMKLKALDLPYSQQKKEWDRADLEFQRNQWFLGSRMASGFEDFALQSKVLESVAYCRMARAAVQARLFHEKTKFWPVKVEDLPAQGKDDYLDPFGDGEKLRITLQGKGIKLTSLGPYEEDGNGMPLGRRAIHWVVEH
jgi:hypothetical protein